MQPTIVTLYDNGKPVKSQGWICLDHISVVTPTDDDNCKVYFGDGGIEVNLSAENVIDLIQNRA